MAFGQAYKFPNVKFCVYAICKNEEKNIEKYLYKVKNADHIVILDTGSTDMSVEYLKSYGRHLSSNKLHVYQLKEELSYDNPELDSYPSLKNKDSFDFAAARNLCLSRAMEITLHDTKEISEKESKSEYKEPVVWYALALDFDHEICDNWRDIIENQLYDYTMDSYNSIHKANLVRDRMPYLFPLQITGKLNEYRNDEKVGEYTSANIHFLYSNIENFYTELEYYQPQDETVPIWDGAIHESLFFMKKIKNYENTLIHSKWIAESSTMYVDKLFIDHKPDLSKEEDKKKFYLKIARDQCMKEDNSTVNHLMINPIYTFHYGLELQNSGYDELAILVYSSSLYAYKVFDDKMVKGEINQQIRLDIDLMNSYAYSTYLNLANLYRFRKEGDRKGNLNLAIYHIMNALIYISDKRKPFIDASDIMYDVYKYDLENNGDEYTDTTKRILMYAILLRVAATQVEESNILDWAEGEQYQESDLMEEIKTWYKELEDYSIHQEHYDEALLSMPINLYLDTKKLCEMTMTSFGSGNLTDKIMKNMEDYWEMLDKVFYDKDGKRSTAI